MRCVAFLPHQLALASVTHAKAEIGFGFSYAALLRRLNMTAPVATQDQARQQVMEEMLQVLTIGRTHVPDDPSFLASKLKQVLTEFSKEPISSRRTYLQ